MSWIFVWIINWRHLTLQTQWALNRQLRLQKERKWLGSSDKEKFKKNRFLKNKSLFHYHRTSFSYFTGQSFHCPKIQFKCETPILQSLDSTKTNSKLYVDIELRNGRKACKTQLLGSFEKSSQKWESCCKGNHNRKLLANSWFSTWGKNIEKISNVTLCSGFAVKTFKLMN